MIAEENKPLPLIGEVLLAKGLITPEALEKALAMQSEGQGKLGTILHQLGLVTQQEIDRCFAEHIITPVITRELDCLTDGRYHGLQGARINYRRLVRSSLVTEDLLNAAAEMTQIVAIKGEAWVSYHDQASLPFEFTIDPRTSSITIDQLLRGGLKVWLRRLCSPGAGGQTSGESAPSP
ncbi:MAG TPA: hypothetical protein PKY77_00620 [Phycisphaerae bacterium]|nr:hypothetical protein [Phycisphaerae bacterium]HRY67643.1 hypothetical protein [Phycisphaerae bacterium]HSA25030.1 hypothetical protein [Phycisphaerae bacterium]